MKRLRQMIARVILAMLVFSSLAHGDTWTANRRLPNTTNASFNPAIAVSGPNIYVVWWNTTPLPEILLIRSDDGGDTWTATRRVSKTGTDPVPYAPAIAVDGTNIYVAWHDWILEDYEIYFKRSGDSGDTWTAAQRLTRNTGSSFFPAIAVDGANIHVVWQDVTPGNVEIFCRRSVDGGNTWQTIRRLTRSTGSSTSPAIAVAGANLYVIWTDHIQQPSDIFLKRSEDGGETWKANKRFTFQWGYSNSPAIAVDGSNVYAVWESNKPGNNEIYFKRSFDSGASWSAARRFTTNTGSSTSPAIAAIGANVYVVWEDVTPGNQEIFFRRSVDGGDTWKANKRFTYNSVSSTSPALAANGANVYVVWEDHIPENPGIYFKKGVLDEGQ